MVRFISIDKDLPTKVPFQNVFQASPGIYVVLEDQIRVKKVRTFKDLIIC